MTGKTLIGNQLTWVEPDVCELWVEPEIRELDVLDTFALPHLGADVGGNPSPDCQRS